VAGLWRRMERRRRPWRCGCRRVRDGAAAGVVGSAVAGDPGELPGVVAVAAVEGSRKDAKTQRDGG